MLTDKADRRKVVVVTGAGSGIGRATAEYLLERGWSVVAAEMNQEAGAALLSSNQPTVGDRFHVEPCDVSQEADVARVSSVATERYGRLDAWVNNAGIGGAFGPITEIEADDWDYTFNVLARGVYLGVKHAARAMRASGDGGAIVNLGSVAGLGGGAGAQAYSSAKAAVINLTRVVAAELANQRVRVNAVCPGVISTPMLGQSDEVLLGQLEGHQPWPEVGTPDDVAAAIAFLVGDESRFITGTTLVVDGGLTAAGPRIEGLLGDPARRGLVGVNRGTSGEKSELHRKLDLQ